MNDAEITALAETILSTSEDSARALYGPLSRDFLLTLLSERDAAIRALLAEREAMRGALEPFIELAVATTVEGSPDYREWVGQSQDWMVALGFAGRTITLGQLRALAALAPPAPAPKEKPTSPDQEQGR